MSPLTFGKCCRVYMWYFYFNCSKASEYQGMKEMYLCTIQFQKQKIKQCIQLFIFNID